jgi:hypothetical protein
MGNAIYQEKISENASQMAIDNNNNNNNKKAPQLPYMGGNHK